MINSTKLDATEARLEQIKKEYISAQLKLLVTIFAIMILAFVGLMGFALCYSFVNNELNKVQTEIVQIKEDWE